MKKYILCFFALTFLYTTYAFAEGEKVIILNDGTRINGRITGLNQGNYVIQSETLGEVRVSQDNIQSIVAPGMAAVVETKPSQAPTTTEAVPTEYTKQMKTVQDQIMASPELMKEITAMASDPEILNLLNDPALLEAATKGNPQAMQTNPRTQELMKNPKMQELLKKIEQSQIGK